ncbi:E3 ubiquitin-protein ligase TRIM35-like [Brienomyrus brachyistius]|uniref:E3 ubiquitin-protein ligase TRIM35-like n=1 Tax=Brienomyrus brachyistius TaxID=42636 RepID=UPI0020B17CC7|nr:E3 ubiquitin-protein ligase TRIM35-like [Brienomyrus brachyistius]
MKTPVKMEAHCDLHGEKLLIFCEDDQESVCVVCQTSKSHRNHHFRPVEEAAQDMKEELRTALNLLNEKLEKIITFKQQYEKTGKHLKSQFQHIERRIKEEFEELHQFLREEEEARLAILRVEEMEKSERMKEKIENISKQVSTLSEKIRDTETTMESGDIFFLKCYEDLKARAQCSLQDPELESGALIDVAKHLGSLKFRVWEKMLGTVQYTPVTLDPNTASPWLSVSDDLTSVRNTAVKQQLPNNPERLVCYPDLQGSEGFSSGQHSWEVEVGDKPEWAVGVEKESVNRKGGVKYSPEDGFWVLYLRNGNKYEACTSPPTHLQLERNPQRIRVQLDYDRGQVSFFNPTDMSLIHTFKGTFTGRLFPYFYLGPNVDGSNPGALQICPVKVSVTVTSSQ